MQDTSMETEQPAARPRRPGAGRAVEAQAKALPGTPGINRSVARALALLMDVTRNTRPLSFAELQRRHKVPKATLHNLLITLETLNFLRRDEDSGRYFIGLAALELSAGGAATVEDLHSILSPVLQKLVRDLNETCHLGIIHGGEEVILKRYDPADQMVRLATMIGRRHPIYATAGGLAALAAGSDETVLSTLPEKLPQLTRNTINSRKKLISRLQQIREQGYALDLEEAYVGVRCVGVAVAVATWPIVHVSLSLPLQRASIERLHELGEPLMDAAVKIKKILTLTPRG